ncbi:MAG TPA: c-type cytochrome [Candidatus Acidoferrales bacterium]|nr:c-type cytochrome [Candidatus Acidoferrales bacterium]
MTIVHGEESWAGTGDEEATVKMEQRRFQRASPLVLAIALAGVLLPGAGGQTPTAPKAEAQLPPLIRSVKGLDLFRAYCASCHGLDGRGAGPAAPALKARVPDLTLLAAKNQKQFPAVRVRQMIMGDIAMAAHGSREMPVWGPIFHQVESDVDWGNVRLASLLEYLQSIQSLSASNSPSGEELYMQHCAVCHGSDLKGSGPIPDPFRAPPDLTTLARRHGGKFPEAYVSDMLRNGVMMPAHGPAEMPIWGSDFAVDRVGSAQAALRITNLTNYIKSLQEK